SELHTWRSYAVEARGLYCMSGGARRVRQFDVTGGQRWGRRRERGLHADRHAGVYGGSVVQPDVAHGLGGHDRDMEQRQPDHAQRDERLRFGGGGGGRVRQLDGTCGEWWWRRRERGLHADRHAGVYGGSVVQPDVAHGLGGHDRDMEQRQLDYAQRDERHRFGGCVRQSGPWGGSDVPAQIQYRGYLSLLLAVYRPSRQSAKRH